MLFIIIIHIIKKYIIFNNICIHINIWRKDYIYIYIYIYIYLYIINIQNMDKNKALRRWD